MSQIDSDLVKRFTEQDRVRSVPEAQAELDAAALKLRADLASQQSAVEAHHRAELQLRSMAVRLWIARLPLKFKVDPWVVASVAASIAGISMGGATVIFGAPLLAVVVAALILPAIIFACTPWFFENVSQQEQNVQTLRAEVEAATHAVLTSDASVSLSRQRQEAARKVFEGLVQAREFPLNRLLSTDVHSMSGSQFEMYLAEVFEFLGYNVRHIGQTGDQGVDLIIWQNNVRVAVQAKCYGGSVGNAAVQEAFSGMVFHNCQRCAVITSSEFTTSAKALARATRCVLVDGSQLEDLVRGVIGL